MVAVDDPQARRSGRAGSTASALGLACASLKTVHAPSAACIGVLNQLLWRADLMVRAANPLECRARTIAVVEMIWQVALLVLDRAAVVVLSHLLGDPDSVAYLLPGRAAFARVPHDVPATAGQQRNHSRSDRLSACLVGVPLALDR